MCSPLRRMVPFVAVAALLGAAAGPARADLILDQSFDPTGNITVNAGLGGINPNQERAQTFTVGVGGILTEVDVFVERFGSGGSLILDLRQTTASGSPTSNANQILGSASVPTDTVPIAPNGAFVAFNVSFLNIQVTPGEQLAVVLRAGANTPPGTSFGWLGSTGNPYPGGTTWERVIGNHDWVNEGAGNFDLGFRTFVDTGSAAAPEPASLMMLGMGAMSLAGYAWRRKRATA